MTMWAREDTSHTGYHRGRANPVDGTHSLVINMAINAYTAVAGGATRQYDQKVVRPISRSNASLVTRVIYTGREVQSEIEDLGDRRPYLSQCQSRGRCQQNYHAENKDRTGIVTQLVTDITMASGKHVLLKHSR